MRKVPSLVLADITEVCVCRATGYILWDSWCFGSLEYKGQVMKTGVVYPQTELGGDPGALKAFAQAAEGLGYDHFILYDHVLGAEHDGRDPPLTGPYTNLDPFHEPLVAFAYLAGLTQRIEFTSGVIVLPQRQTALVAKQAADVDLYCDGRLRLGVGVGWNWVEFDALEVSGHFRRRGKREEAQIELLRRLWNEPLVTIDDGNHQLDRVGILPRPKRQIPIWLGGFSAVAYERAAKLADGFMFSGRSQAHAVDIKSSMDARLAELGRDPKGFGYECIQQFNRGPGSWPGDIQTWEAAGGTHVSVVTMGAGLTTVDQHIEAIRAWRSAYDSTR